MGFQISQKEPAQMRNTFVASKPLKPQGPPQRANMPTLANSTSSPGLGPLKGKSLDVYTGQQPITKASPTKPLEDTQ